MSDTIKLSKRGRGRPKGTGKPDQATLQQVAELLLDNPGMRHTAAIKRIIGGANPSAIRRLQVKWKEHGSQLRAEAEQRRQRRRTRAAAPGSVSDYTWIPRAVIDGGISSVASQMRSLFDDMNIKAAADQASLGSALAAVERTMSPALTLAAEVNRAMSPVHDVHARMERMMDDPVARACAGLEDMTSLSAASRAAQLSTHHALAPQMRAIMEQATLPALSIDTRSLMPPTLSMDTRSLMPPTLSDPMSEAQRLIGAMRFPWRRPGDPE